MKSWFSNWGLGRLFFSNNFKSFFAERYKLIRLGRQLAVPVAACRKACSEYGLGFMPLANKDDIQALSRFPEYREDRLIITDGIEKYYNYRSSIFTFPSGKEVTGVSSTKGGYRKRGWPGTYCMNIYYGKYVSRDCVVDTNDLCACKRGEFILILKSFHNLVTLVSRKSFFCLETFLHDQESSKKAKPQSGPLQAHASSFLETFSIMV